MSSTNLMNRISLDDVCPYEQMDVIPIENTREEKKCSDISGNYVPPSLSSSTFLLDKQQLIDQICKLCEKIYNTGKFFQDIHIGYSGRNILFTNFIVEINQVRLHNLTITREQNTNDIDNNSNNYKYIASLVYSKGYLESYIKSELCDTIESSIKQLLEKTKKLKWCSFCEMGYNSELCDYCVCCLVSDLLTYDNSKITCPICLQDTKDYITISCGHRYHFTCISKNKTNKCPICRSKYTINGMVYNNLE